MKKMLKFSTEKHDAVLMQFQQNCITFHVKLHQNCIILMQFSKLHQNFISNSSKIQENNLQNLTSCSVISFQSLRDMSR